MNLIEAKQVLKDNGFICEVKRIPEYKDMRDCIAGIFKDVKLKEISDGYFEAQKMEEYDVITYYDWDRKTDTLNVSFSSTSDDFSLANFSKHFTVKRLDGISVYRPDTVLSNFINKITDAWENSF